MKDTYLWDTNNKSLVGNGVDSIGSKEVDGFKFYWFSNHPQITKAKVGKYTLETVFWYTYYEARVEYYDREMESSQVKCKSRIEAQHEAEALFIKIIKEGNELIKNIE